MASKLQKMVYKDAQERISEIVDGLFTIIDTENNLTPLNKELIMRDMHILLSIKHSMGGE